MVLKSIALLLFLCATAQAQTVNPYDIDVPPGIPTISVNAGAGTGGVASLAGPSNNTSGVIVISAGTGTTPSSTLATITFGGTDTHTACSLTAANINAVGQAAMIYVVQPVNGIWSIGVGGAPIQPNFTYIWGYTCI